MSLLVICKLASAKVVLIGKNTILSFDDVEATFSKFSQLLLHVTIFGYVSLEKYKPWISLQGSFWKLWSYYYMAYYIGLEYIDLH